MLHISSTTRIRLLLFGLALLLGGALKSLASRYWFVQTNTVLYGTVVTAWVLSIQSRILKRSTRYSLIAAGSLILCLLVFRGCKNVYFVEVPSVWQYFWYAYYPAYIGISLACFFAAASLSDGLRSHLHSLYYLLIPAVLLSMGILTNDLHQLAFRFLPGTAPNDGLYSYGPLFFVNLAWNFFFMAVTILLIYRQCRIPHIRSYAAIPFGILMAFGAYFLIDLLAGTREFVWDVPRFFERPEMYCFMIMSFWEACIQIGMVPSNSSYEAILRISDISAVFLNDDKSEALVSENAYVPGAVDVAAVEAQPVRIDENTLLHGHRLEGGGVLWVEDVSAVNRLNEELAETAERLSEENMLLEAENAWREQQSSYEVQNRLYDEIHLLVTPQLAEIGLLAEEVRALRTEEGADPAGGQYREQILEKLARMAFLGAYVKRRANLRLVAETQKEISGGTIPAEELFLSLRESLEYLRLHGIVAGILREPEGGPAAGAAFPKEQVFLCYDFFQYTLEQALPGLTAVQVILGAGEGLRLRIGTDNASGLPEQDWKREEIAAAGGTAEIRTEDETTYVRLAFPKPTGKEAEYAVR